MELYAVQNGEKLLHWKRFLSFIDTNYLPAVIQSGKMTGMEKDRQTNTNNHLRIAGTRDFSKPAFDGNALSK